MSQEIYNLAAELKENEIENVLALWAKEDAKSLKTFNNLVSLGDSRALALATVLDGKAEQKEGKFEAYYAAYCI
jgi:hypothetical protein